MKKPDVISYPAIFDNQDNDGCYTVTFPDIRNTVSQGRTAESISKAPDALAVALPDYQEYPHPSNLKTIQAEHSDEIVRLVRVNMKDKLREMKQKPQSIHELFSGWTDDDIRESELDWGKRKGHRYRKQSNEMSLQKMPLNFPYSDVRQNKKATAFACWSLE
ncbi:hypothetical protein LASUN_10550 [Lentilactobacillus sunkii]|jgi:antitoxin HicB|uniref:HicB-like antitoxin of toxin-antitoxin system domain-containing protein n=1 Tax=Lentilactobacillus sunkii TaxID=481719 RepID=A0A1E7XEC2_9LACO|nr:HicB family protein [Lentilactobacillus sunkii]OFA11446.1 hypothetical protein LASUN_10550 [Lentilactobacillus sunkii]